MKRLILIAPAALFLVSAQPPAGHAGHDKAREGELNSVNAASAPAPAVKKAPKAAPAPVRHTTARAAATNYPRCSATVTDRCVQGRGSSTYRSAALPAPRRQQYAMRAGERG